MIEQISFSHDLETSEGVYIYLSDDEKSDEILDNEKDDNWIVGSDEKKEKNVEYSDDSSLHLINDDEEGSADHINEDEDEENHAGHVNEDEDEEVDQDDYVDHSVRVFSVSHNKICFSNTSF